MKTLPERSRSVKRLRFDAQEQAMLAANISDNAFRVYQLLDRYARYDSACYPRQKRLATDLHQSVRSIKRSIAELRDAGFIRVQKTAAGNVYQLTGRQGLQIASTAVENPEKPLRASTVVN